MIGRPPAVSSDPMKATDYRNLVERDVVEKWEKATPSGAPLSDIRVGDRGCEYK